MRRAQGSEGRCYVLRASKLLFARAARKQWWYTQYVTSPDDVRRADRRCAAFSPPIAAAAREMQEFLLHNVYMCGDNLARDRQGQRVIRELFEAFTTDPSRLPRRYRRRTEADGLHRVVCDYIAGMTDRFCQREHARLCAQ